MKLTTKQNEDFAVRKGKDKEGPFVELLTGWDAEQFILTPKEAIRLGNALIKAAQPKDPAGNMGPQKYRADDVPAVDWNK